jgi:membrane-bound lytic murein transglycosylase D
MAVKNIVLSPATYGIDLDSVPDQPYFTTVEAPAKIDVKIAAKLAGMSEEEFVALNPAHRKPVAFASGGTLVVPLDKAEAFKENLEAYDKPLVSWTTVNARRGESIDSIAGRNGFTRHELLAVNDTLRIDKRGRLRSAGPVLVPMKRTPATHVAAAAVRTASTGAAHPGIAAKANWYVVRAGDTLYGIARRFDVALDAVRELNNLSAQAIIQPGLKLQLR